ncbi:probable pectin methyltransferase QUA2 [Chenopodium quinoa]|uniref:Methyltransferase n=1 Tax=Chenopodium quinoa TaxID=63459 RepID=A0A803KSI3_CHEQI|nr:probable pectin methyltransferase QUA2 [Chenopodium quinoa]XP_021752852.1 probable pectin methyltransferase QUA2 [Chenopodium quinoa]
MVGPHNRAGSSGRLREADLAVSDLENGIARKKDKEKGDSCKASISDYVCNAVDDHCFGVEKVGGVNGKGKLQHNLFSFVLKLVVAIVAFFVLLTSIRRMVSITNKPLLVDNFAGGYWWLQLQEQLISDFSDIQELSLGSSRVKEVEFCSQEYENYVPCFNTSENTGNSYLERQCERGLRLNCVVLPPRNYRLPLRWPSGRDVIWYANVKISAQEVLTSGAVTKRLMMLEEGQISFRSDSLMFDGVDDYSHQIADMIGLRSVSDFNQAGIRSVLDIGCGYGSFGAHLFSRNLLTMCIANYEPSGSQVQLTLERGLPAMIASFSSKRLPFSSLSFDMLHCARCGINWDEKDGIFLVEADRLLKPGGYFVWTSPVAGMHGSHETNENQKKWQFVLQFAESLCWDMLSPQDDTVIWRKTTHRNCYAHKKHSSNPPICEKKYDVESPYYQPLHLCIGGTRSERWIPIKQRTAWPSRASLNSSEIRMYGVLPEVFSADSLKWKSAIQEYWSLLSPQIFSDHPKRPGDEDPSPPFNMLRNVLDMNAQFGGFNHALLEAGKNLWVMNVVPTTAANSLPLIHDRGFIGTSHNWCEAFPSYPRTYDMIHAFGLLSLEPHQHQKCTMLDLFLDIDRLLRPEGWVIFRDTPSMIELARTLATRFRWDARTVDVEANIDERVLICRKPFPGDKV